MYMDTYTYFVCELLKMDVDGIFLSVLKPTLKTHPDTL